MKLGERLAVVASFVKDGSKIADIGTDHAKVPIYLAENKKISFALASDKNKGPLNFAKENISRAGLGKLVETRIGDGLKCLRVGEVDTVIIAGMGGALIAEILSSSPDILNKIPQLILQPMNEGNILRNWLQENNRKIESEKLVKEDCRIYEVIYAVCGRMKKLNRMESIFGPLILKTKDPLLKERIENIGLKTKKIILGMEKSESAVKSEEYSFEKNKLKSLEELSKNFT